MKMLMFKTIKAKIMTSVIFFSILFSLFTSVMFYSNFQKLLIDNMVAVTNANLRLIMDNMDEDFKSAQSIIEWSTVNGKLDKILEKDKNDPAITREKLEFLEKLNSAINSSTISDDIQKILIAGGQDISFQLGKTYGHMDDISNCTNSGWFEYLLQNDNILWLGIVDSPFESGSMRYVIPAVRPVYSHLKHRNVGWLLLALDSDMVWEYISKYASYKDSEVMIFNNAGHIIAHKDYDLVGSSVRMKEQLFSSIGGTSQGRIEYDTGGGNRIAIYYRSPVTGWYILQTLSTTEIQEQKSVFVKIIIFTVLAIILIGIGLTGLLSNYINKPIKTMNHKIKQIARGDFTVDPGIESDDEIGEIGKGINRMSGDILKLMNNAVEDEKSKRELEFCVLQMQVNPHFLYNTLNSVKWMATIQKTTGISEMISALSRLLRNMAKGFSNEISLDEELSLVQDYVVIQQYRYAGLFTVEYDFPGEILQHKILKFTLQPIVENAIFHGLAPKQSGSVHISARKADNNIRIKVRDNGIGLTGQKIEEILKTSVLTSKEGLSSIGVANVNERIKRTYGEQYGLAIQSKLGEYTEIIITIPAKE